MEKWNFDRCVLCLGKGRIQGTVVCPLCEGEGIWEFITDDTAEAVASLTEGTDNVRARFLANGRLSSFTPDNIEEVLADMSDGLVYSTAIEEIAFDALHKAGAARWGWSWVHTNRFAVELCRLCGGNPTIHRYALSRLAARWLDNEVKET